MRKIYLISFVVILFSCTKGKIISPQNGSLEPDSKGEIISHTYYKLAYSEDNEQPYWVYYELTPELINGTEQRTDDFREDPLVSTGSATLDDYKGSGYDRGHLCPAADMKLNKTSMSESFFLSNMSPQMPRFNSGIWNQLEAKVRSWALQFSKLDVVTGPIFQDNLGTIGENNVTVPGYFYKILYDEKSEKMIGFIMRNAASSKKLDQFIVKVDVIEQKTGINFFPGLPDELENKLEGNIDKTSWGY